MLETWTGVGNRVARDAVKIFFVALGGILTIPDCDLKASRVLLLLIPFFWGLLHLPKLERCIKMQFLRNSLQVLPRQLA
jgi:hypothetical protein